MKKMVFFLSILTTMLFCSVSYGQLNYERICDLGAYKIHENMLTYNGERTGINTKYISNMAQVDSDRYVVSYPYYGPMTSAGNGCGITFLVDTSGYVDSIVIKGYRTSNISQKNFFDAIEICLYSIGLTKAERNFLYNEIQSNPHYSEEFIWHNVWSSRWSKAIMLSLSDEGDGRVCAVIMAKP